ncbi:hypothetical protein NQX30_04840 [Candidatus Persebacteraceae bacterium Df01]|jgi:ElaB/YqjD/DUF883 family membrane-anchored ribosome-binding protein|uniref:DUF883 domain-containing protein n=1 Tax=Candidatus Doriopsillibacter californiensis TaxID=2970740 RepID=A0ABT7QM16_9GAMM|nr:hypothetical protein [Candidatus Persebacteraceae bacterium Df01]
MTIRARVKELTNATGDHASNLKEAIELHIDELDNRIDEKTWPHLAGTLAAGIVIGVIAAKLL